MTKKNMRGADIFRTLIPCLRSIAAVYFTEYLFSPASSRSSYLLQQNLLETYVGVSLSLRAFPDSAGGQEHFNFILQNISSLVICQMQIKTL